LRLLADRTGLTGELSKAVARGSFTPRHDRGGVLIDGAVMLADGGEAIANIDVLRAGGMDFRVMVSYLAGRRRLP
jgi:hypothetical protein